MFVISFSETMVLVGSTQECIEENQQPFGGVIADKNVQAHDAQKEKPTKESPFEDLSAKKSFAIDGSGRIPFLL